MAERIGDWMGGWMTGVLLTFVAIAAFRVFFPYPPIKESTVLEWVHQERLGPVRRLTCQKDACVLQLQRGPPRLVRCLYAMPSSCSSTVAEKL